MDLEAKAGPQAPTEHGPHVLVVEDDLRLRGLLVKFLTESGYRATGAPSAEAARDVLSSLAFDLIVLDIMLPGMSGLDLTRELRRTSDVPIILLTARGAPEDRINGFEHGADDYLAKPFEPRELLLRVNSILKRTFRTEPELAEDIRMGECRYNPTRGELWRGQEQIKLTSSENALLRLFAKNPGKTYTRSDLCHEMGVAQERSIDVQITRLRRKIEADPKMPLYLQTVRSIGYVLIPD